MMLMYYIRDKLLEVLDSAYPDIQKYSHFFIDVNFKESPRTFSKYDYSKRRITVGTLSRNSGDIFISYLIELSRHIDIINRRETHEDKVYLDILRKLLDHALKRNVIEIKDLQTLRNKKLKDVLQSSYGSFSKWQYDDQFQGEYIYIRVYESFMINNILKVNKYYYDFDQLCWLKRVKVKEHDEEEIFIHEYKNLADFHISSDNRFKITPAYKLVIETYSYEHSNLLKALSFRYVPEKHSWYKGIFAKDLEQELHNIRDCPNQRIYVTRNIR